jgi:hypothetical protein
MRVRSKSWPDPTGAATFLAAALAALLLAAADAPPIPASLGIPGSNTQPQLKFEPFTGLPEGQPARFKSPEDPGRIVPGTEGLNLPAPARTSTGATLAILGDLAPAYVGGNTSEKYLQMAVRQLNLLRPDLVLTVGNLVPGLTRDGRAYIQQVQQVRRELDTLDMPWYPCAGERDLESGTRDPADRRFEALYRQHQGPLYYSIDTGNTHIVVLNSEERLADGADRGIGEAQLRWLRNDLNRTFDNATGGGGAGGGGGARTRWVVVILHRPLWRNGEATNGWARAHELLVDFNRRPIVRFEGSDRRFGTAGTAINAPAPRVVAIVAGSQRGYALDANPLAGDGIRRFVMGPTAAMPPTGQDAVTAVRGMLLLKLEPEAPHPPATDAGASAPGGKQTTDGGVHPAVIALGTEGPADGQLIMPEDVITGAQREVIDSMAGWGDDVMGIDGIIDERSGIQQAKGLRMRISNPLAGKVDMAPRSAGTRFLFGSRREGANTFVEGFDLPWEMASRHMLRQLDPGESYSWEMGFTRAQPGTGLDFSPPAPPQVELLVHWVDAGGRAHQVVLKRRVALAARVRLPVITNAREETFWADAVAAGELGTGSAYAWTIRGDEPRKFNPSWQMAVDGEKLYIKVRVDDSTPSYWPRMTLDSRWGGLASDAVSIAWAKDEKSQDAQRIWVLPFAPGGPELWTNTGIAEKARPLLKLDPKTGISAQLQRNAGKGYEVALAMPRSLIFSAAPASTAPTTAPATAPATAVAPTIIASAIMNISVHDNDEGAQTWSRSWARETLGPAAWGRVEVSTKP